MVLAAGAGSRFGGGKLLAELNGRPLLDHVLATVREGGPAQTIVVVGPAATGLEAIAAANGARTVVNPAPEEGLSSSVRIGLAVLAVTRAEDLDGALIVLGDQPRTSLATIKALLAAEVPEGRSIVVPRYRGGGGPNPALLLRPAWPLAAQLQGDRGFRSPDQGPSRARRRGRPARRQSRRGHRRRPRPGRRGRLGRARPGQPGAGRADPGGAGRADFYAPVRSLFRADPTRTDDPVLRRPPRPGPARARHGWTSGREPAGSRCRSPAPSTRRAARSLPWTRRPRCSPPARDRRRACHPATCARSRHAGRRMILATAPPASADVVLIAHVGYDIEAIGPFLDALEAAARRCCVAVLMDRVPASAADPFWPLGPRRGRANACRPCPSSSSSCGLAGANRRDHPDPGRKPAASTRARASRASSGASSGSIRPDRRRRASRPPSMRWRSTGRPVAGPIAGRRAELTSGSSPGVRRRARAVGARSPTRRLERGGDLRPARRPLLAGYPDPMIELAERLRAIVRRAVPDAIEAVRPGWR